MSGHVFPVGFFTDINQIPLQREKSSSNFPELENPNYEEPPVVMIVPPFQQASGVSSATEYVFDDPVWGTAIFSKKPGIWKSFAFNFCPCFFTGRAYRKQKVAALHSLSIMVLVVEVALLVASLACQGFAPVNINPLFGPFPPVLHQLGAKNASSIVYQREYWRFFTAIFVHSGLVHFLVNGFVQFRFGLFLEKQWGYRVWGLVFFGSGINGFIFSTYFFPDTLSVGASGALIGLLGGWIMKLLLNRGKGNSVEQKDNTKHLKALLLQICFIFIFSAVPFVDWAAHLGGLLMGLLMGALNFSTNKATKISSLILIVSMLSFGTFLITFHLAPNKEMVHYCQYFSSYYFPGYECTDL